MAGRAYGQLDSGISIFLVDDLDIDRLAYCSRCDDFPMDKGRVDQLLLSSMQGLIQKILNWDEYGDDPELMTIRDKERRRRFRDKHKEGIKIDKRIEHLQSLLNRRVKEVLDG